MKWKLKLLMVKNELQNHHCGKRIFQKINVLKEQTYNLRHKQVEERKTGPECKCNVSGNALVKLVMMINY